MAMQGISGAAETVEAAPAKVNLALHVTGQRADGYHLLESLVVFTEAGDTIHIQDADQDRLAIFYTPAMAAITSLPGPEICCATRSHQWVNQRPRSPFILKRICPLHQV